jgi:hypothetical protein
VPEGRAWRAAPHGAGRGRRRGRVRRHPLDLRPVVRRGGRAGLCAHLHARISKDPSNVALLQEFFLRLSSTLDGPVERMRQLRSPEAARITGYYSSQLVAFVRNVLDVVPVFVFAILVQMSDVIERRLQRLPPMVPADRLIAYAQLGKRYKLAMMAHEISIFADSEERAFQALVMAGSPTARRKGDVVRVIDVVGG